MIKQHAVTLSDLEIVSVNSARDFSGTEYRVKIGGDTFVATNRFWSSFGSRYLINRDMFRFFTPAEVLNRCIEKKGNTECIVTSFNGELHAMVDPKATIMKHSDVEEILGEGVQIIGSMFTLERDFPNMKLKINEEPFTYRSRFEIPIDGYGNTTATSGLLRLACLNGAVASTRLTETVFKLTGDHNGALRRAVDTYQNDVGFEHAEKRMSIAMKTNASLNEITYCSKAVQDSGLGEYLPAFNKATGNLHAVYGMSSFGGLSERKRSLVPSECTVFEAMNLLTELSTHMAEPHHKIHLHRAIHHMLGKNEFDLEGISAPKKKVFTARYFG